jgi:hypothetical protein
MITEMWDASVCRSAITQNLTEISVRTAQGGARYPTTARYLLVDTYALAHIQALR